MYKKITELLGGRLLVTPEPRNEESRLIATNTNVYENTMRTFKSLYNGFGTSVIHLTCRKEQMDVFIV